MRVGHNVKLLAGEEMNDDNRTHKHTHTLLYARERNHLWVYLF